MRLLLAVLVGRLVRILAKMRGGGSAIPGRIALIIEPAFLKKTLGSLKHGVIFISGSNGKSTTTALVAAALRSQNLKVFSNPSGGNMPQGIASAVIGEANLRGELSSDVAVLEVDEAYGEILAKHFLPTHVVLTNIQIDQLNRFFEPERVYGMLLNAAKSATASVVINGTDANLRALVGELPNPKVAISVSATDDALRYWPEGALAAPRFGDDSESNELSIGAQLLSLDGDRAKYALHEVEVELKLPGKGLHFALDAGLALTLAERILGSDFSPQAAAQGISNQETVYGRGEIAKFDGVEIQILMMKNPSSMRATLLAMDDPETSVWIAMDEGTPDPSWIFDIDPSRIRSVRVVSGSRCWHWATRLAYSDIELQEVIPSSKRALETYVQYLKSVNKRGTLITNYEQMMVIRKLMGYLDLETGK